MPLSLAPTRSGGSQSCTGSFRDQLTLEFGQRRKNPKEQPTVQRGVVDLRTGC